MTTLASDVIQQRERELRATSFLAATIARDGHLRTTETPEDELRARNLARFYTKSGGLVSLDDETFDETPVRAAFLAETNQKSVLGAIVAAGATVIDLAGAGRVQVGELEAEVTAEGAQKTIATFLFEDAGGTLYKIVAALAVTNDLLRSVDLRTQQGLSKLLTSAVAKKTDVQVVSVLTSGSSSSDASPGTLLAAISGGRPVAPMLVGGYDSLLGLAGTLRDLATLSIPVIPCAAAQGVLIAIDAAGVLVSADDVRLDVARHATIALNTSPETTISLWQTNTSAIRAERWIRLALRDGCVAWAAAGSPA